jgi:hypothetical protein
MKKTTCAHLLKLPKDIQDFIFDRMGFGDALNCLRTSRELYFEERHWTALFHRFFGQGKGGRKEVFSAVREGVELELLVRSVYPEAPFSYYCSVEAVRVIPNVAFGLRIHEQGDGSLGAIQNPAGSRVLSGNDTTTVERRPSYTRFTEQSDNHVRGWLWFVWISDAEEVYFRYGSSDYDRSETIKLSLLNTGAKTAELVRQGVRFHIAEGDHWIISHGCTLVYSFPRGTLFWSGPHDSAGQGWRVPASKATFTVLLVFGASYSFTPGSLYDNPGDVKPPVKFVIDAAFVRANPNLLPWIIF